MYSNSTTKLSAAVTIALGVLAIILPYFAGTAAVMLLGALIFASGIVALVFVYVARKADVSVSVFGPWVQIVAGVVLLIWPQLALWLVALVLGGGLVLNGLMGLSALKQSPVVNPPAIKEVALWLSIVLGVLLIAMGAAGSAVILGVVLGLALIGNGFQQWRVASDEF